MKGASCSEARLQAEHVAVVHISPPPLVYIIYIIRSAGARQQKAGTAFFGRARRGKCFSFRYFDAGVATSSPSRTRASAENVDALSVAKDDQIFAASVLLPAEVSARAASAM